MRADRGERKETIAQHVPAVPVRQRILIQHDAPVARLTEGAEGERSVLSEGAEDEAGGGGRAPRGSVQSDRKR